MNAKEAVERYYGGDVSAMADVIECYRFALRQKLYLLRKDAALEEGDLLSAIAEGVLMGLRRGGKRVLGVIYWSVRSCLRKLERHAVETVTLIYDPEVFDSPQDFELHVDLYRAMNKLCGRERQVAILWSDGVTIRESADILGVSARRVEQIRQRVSNSIRGSLGNGYLHTLQPV